MSAPSGRWRLTVDRDRCIGSGICAGMAPSRFELVAGAATPLIAVGPPDDAVIDAAESCPVEAISVRDADDGRLIAPES